MVEGIELGKRGNRTYKDTLFRDLFGAPERRAYALSLYNALAGTNYEDPAELEVTTLRDVLYLGGRKNDVSFLVGSELVLWEQQSTRNPNMPLRGLFYLSRLYEAWIERNDENIYSSGRITLPRPCYVVFYAGSEGRPEREELRLSDAFRIPNGLGPGNAGVIGDPALEVVATVVNVNEGHSEGLMAACSALAGYARFVGLVRAYNGAMPLPEAIRGAMRQCVAEGVLVDYLTEREAEVPNMILEEWDEERQAYLVEVEKRRAVERASEQGREQVRRELLERAASLVRRGDVDIAAARALLGPEEAAELSQILAADDGAPSGE